MALPWRPGLPARRGPAGLRQHPSRRYPPPRTLRRGCLATKNAPAGHRPVRRPRRLHRDVRAARCRGGPRDHDRVPPSTRGRGRPATRAPSTSSWATPSWPCSARRSTHEDDPARALWAALGCSERWRRSTWTSSASAACGFALRIGIESGDVVAGVRDVAGVREYTVIGDAVNVAARLQAATRPEHDPGGRRHRAANPAAAFAFQTDSTIVLKGKEQPVRAFLLLGPAEHWTPTAAVRPAWSRRWSGAAASLRARRLPDELRRGRGRSRLLSASPGSGSPACWPSLRARADGRDLGALPGVRARGRGQLRARPQPRARLCDLGGGRAGSSRQRRGCALACTRSAAARCIRP